MAKELISSYVKVMTEEAMTVVRVITVQKAVMRDVGDTTSVKEAAKVEEIVSGFRGNDSCCKGSS